jgi:hypothetical protein
LTRPIAATGRMAMRLARRAPPPSVLAIAPSRARDDRSRPPAAEVGDAGGRAMALVIKSARGRHGSWQALAFGLLVAAAGCHAADSTAASAPKGAKAAAAADDWELVGWRIIGCCCPSPCPCRLNKKPMNCHGCDHTDVVHVDRGTLHGVKMDGVTYALVGRAFGESADSSWVYCYVDQKTSEAQVGALQQMLNDTVKAWGAKAPYLAGKFVGLRKVPMTVAVSADKNEYDVEVPGILTLKTKAIYNPGHKEPVVSTGIMDAFGDRFVHSDTLVHKYDDKSIGYSWDLTGRQSNQATFTLNQKRVDQGGIGWGCWSAHAAFGDTEKYGEQLIGHQ